MRPIDLTPTEQRRRRTIGVGRGRTGFAVYGILGVLAFAVIAVSVLVLTSNKVNDRKEKVADLQTEQQTAKAAADALRPYGNFAQMQRARVATIKSLTETTFNWERVVRALSRTIPSNVWLSSFKGSVRPGVGGEGGGGGGTGLESLRSQSTSPAIELVGCTYSHRSVARMMTRMRNLDGVTEVVLGSSERPQGQGANGGGPAPSEPAGDTGGGGGGATQTGGECRTKYHIAKFEILVVFGGLSVGEPTPDLGGASPTPTDGAQGAVATANSASAGAASASPGGGTAP